MYFNRAKQVKELFGTKTNKQNNIAALRVFNHVPFSRECHMTKPEVTKVATLIIIFNMVPEVEQEVTKIG